jgi:hypothetical protein
VTKTTGFEVVHRLLNLRSGIHDEWSVVLDGLADRSSTEQEDFKIR